uniref:Uncharacterized protein n=1 Tax=Sipha flava TaxID=143950 RepID=A0A2S2Q6P1_9HEMI
MEIDQENFIIGQDNFFNTENFLKLRRDMQKYYIDDIKTQQPRDDYFELLKLCQIFLGKPEKTEVRFRASSSLVGEDNFLLNIYMFQDPSLFLLHQRKRGSLK